MGRATELGIESNYLIFYGSRRVFSYCLAILKAEIENMRSEDCSSVNIIFDTWATDGVLFFEKSKVAL